MESYLPLVIPKSTPINVYYKKHPEENAVFVCCLSNKLKRVKKWFKVCGSIKDIERGEIEKKGKPLYYAVVTFKKKHSVKRCMDNLWLSRKVSELYSKDSVMAEPIDERLSQHIGIMEEDGFSLVTPKNLTKVNKFDRFVPVEDVQVGVKRKKKEKFLNNFYSFQVDPENSLKKMRKTEE